MDKRKLRRQRQRSPADRGDSIIRTWYVGIDVGSESHVVAAVTADGAVIVKPTKITEDAAAYARLFALLGQGPVALVTMKATWHYWLPSGRPAREAKVRIGRRPPPKVARSLLERSKQVGTTTTGLTGHLGNRS